MNRIVKVGHRGAAGYAPENTLASLQHAIGLGLDFAEFDLRRTQDGVLILLHDKTVDRTTNGKGPVDHFSFRDLKALDAGHGNSIPSLEEALRLADRKIGLLLELKVPGIAQDCIETVQHLRLHSPVIYASFLLEELADLRDADHRASTMALFSNLPSDPLGIVATVRPSQATHVGLRHDTVTPDLIQDLHQTGWPVFAYTANDPADIERLKTFGIDGIISDYPDRI
jgi:glycerophosphoryl diester phosphodiesterase